jgi:radical SAM protein with 4Fe4S-binding SPASM domain
MNNEIKVSEHMRSYKIDEDCILIWNRFLPSVLKINQAGMDFINRLKKCNDLHSDENHKSAIELLSNYRILYKGSLDSSQKDLSESYDRLLKKIANNAEKFYQDMIPYSRLCIANDSCNLNCSYCIRRHKNPYTPKKISDSERINLLNIIVDQFFSRILRSRKRATKISFNGGEIFLQWPILKNIIERISRKYPEIEITYTVNTNMTLMTEEISKFISNYNFEVYISIDGYKEAHNRTRKYSNGAGSFDDVLKGVEIFRKYNKNFNIRGFQGTIEHIDIFEPKKIYAMEKYGFDQARLAPNLINTSEISAKKKAQMFGKIIDLNLKEHLKVNEIYFDNMEKIINNEKYILYANCRGLSAFPLKIIANLDTFRISQICDYVILASVPFEELGGDIYNPLLWERSYSFIRARVDALFKNCINCDLIGICRGGCIYTGLDKENKINPEACVYQNELWKVFLDKIYNLSKKAYSEEKSDSNEKEII